MTEDRLLRALRDPLLWEAPSPAASRAWDEIEPMFNALQAEDSAAAALCEQLLAGPPASWPDRLRRTPGAYTLGMARQLLQRRPAAAESRPAGALQMTSMAIEIAERLDPRKYWPDHLTHVRAQALRDHASVLSFMGRYAAALEYVERAARLFEHVPAAELDLAQLALVKASALRMQNRSDEAVALAHAAGETFLRFWDRLRYVNARITEAALLYDGGAVERALEVWSSLPGDPGIDPIGELRVTHNIALCLCDLGRREEAVAPLQRCVSEFERLGLASERTRSRWYLGNALLGTARQREAIVALRTAWREFAEMDLMVDAALAALDLAEALVANEEPEQVPMLCHEVIAQLTNAGLAAQAIPALSLLREAAAMGRASRAFIRRTHAMKRATFGVRQRPGARQEPLAVD